MAHTFTSKINIPNNTPSSKAELDRLVNDIAEDVISHIQFGLSDDDINFTGDLSDSIRHEEISGYETIIIDNPYAGFVEYGLPAQGGIVGGGMALNIDQLRSWVFHKLGITDEAENLSVTWKIAKKIQNEGIKPKRFVKKALKRLIAKKGVPNKKRIKKAKANVGFFSKMKKKLKKMKILQKIKKATKKVDKMYKQVRKYK